MGGKYNCNVKCGDGKVITPDEECDDAGTGTGDGCDDTCKEEDGWICNGASPTVCTEDLSDSTIVGDEVCDDGTPGDGRGCTADGLGVLPGWDCPCTPDCKCTPICNDLIIISPETCADGNT